MPDPSTTRLGLYKSKSDGSELSNYTQDLGQNLDKLDLAAGFQIVTSSTRPGTPYPGKPIAESDTAYRSYFNNGTAPASGGWIQIPNSSSTFNADLTLVAGKQINLGQSSSAASVAIVNPATTTNSISVRVTGDTQSRWLANADGTLTWGPGGVTLGDTNLYRSAANTLATDDDLAINAVGKGLLVKEGTNAKMGLATLVAGTVVVATTAAGATSRIFLTAQTTGGTAGALRVSARTAGTSFTITSTSATDTSTVAWMIVNPA